MARAWKSDIGLRAGRVATRPRRRCLSSQGGARRTQGAGACGSEALADMASANCEHGRIPVLCPECAADREWAEAVARAFADSDAEPAGGGAAEVAAPFSSSTTPEGDLEGEGGTRSCGGGGPHLRAWPAARGVRSMRASGGVWRQRGEGRCDHVRTRVECRGLRGMCADPAARRREASGACGALGSGGPAADSSYAPQEGPGIGLCSRPSRRGRGLHGACAGRGKTSSLTAGRCKRGGSGRRGRPRKRRAGGGSRGGRRCR